jgi:hypothetical protein
MQREFGQISGLNLEANVLQQHYELPSLPRRHDRGKLWIAYRQAAVWVQVSGLTRQKLPALYVHEHGNDMASVGEPHALLHSASLVSGFFPAATCVRATTRARSASSSLGENVTAPPSPVTSFCSQHASELQGRRLSAQGLERSRSL